MGQYLCIGEGPKWGPKRRGLEGSINMGFLITFVAYDRLTCIQKGSKSPLLGPLYGPKIIDRAVQTGSRYGPKSGDLDPFYGPKTSGFAVQTGSRNLDSGFPGYRGPFLDPLNEWSLARARARVRARAAARARGTCRIT